MSIIDQVRGPLPLSWLRKSATVEAPAELLAARLPSLASVEYELYELRASLRGVVDFGDEKPKSSASLASPPSPSLKRNNALQGKLVTLAS